MNLTKADALRAYAKMWNTLSTEALESLLADDFTYESQWVFEALTSKQAFLDYIRSKIETVRQAKAKVYAEMGVVSAYGERQPCVVLAQNAKSNLVGLVLAEVKDNKLTRIDLCIVPAPQAAERSGEYPV